MKALLVTSRVHFAPENYDDVIIPLVMSEHVGGLLVIRDNCFDLVFNARTRAIYNGETSKFSALAGVNVQATAKNSLTLRFPQTLPYSEDTVSSRDSSS